ncbi:GntR family transcriptional regulator [Paenarthrobacter sp. NPDC090520]|uniref:GntR family transcriptional regulator n=1 Tax=Paenarthrobacter sp. NPDC090520 TaxID=3364382 RepID=UPI00380F915B
MRLAQIEPGGLVGEQVFDAIYTSIMNGDFEAGQKLRIEELSAQLGVSHMPVREALRRLEETGLVDNPPRRTAVVKEFHLQELLHVYSSRRILEDAASKEGSQSLARGDLKKMRAEHTALKVALREGRIADYLDHDERLLGILYAAAGNPVLLELIRNLWTRCRSYKILGVRQALATGDTSPLWQWHEELLAAVAREDGDAVSRVIDESLLAAIDRIRGRLPHQAGS